MRLFATPITLLAASTLCLCSAQTSGAANAARNAGPSSAPGSGSQFVVGPEDNCSTPAVIAGQGNFPYDQTGATTGSQGQICSGSINDDIWFVWTADITGSTTISTCNNTSTDTELAAYPGSACPTNGSALACNDDTCGLQSSITFDVTSGTQYMLQVGTFSAGAGSVGSFDILITPPPTPGQPFCFGDGSGGACPCGSFGSSGEGCANSSGAGALFAASGTASLGNDSFQVDITGLPGAVPGLILRGANQLNGGIGLIVGDGLLCVGGSTGRSQVQFSTGGAVTFTNFQGAGFGASSFGTGVTTNYTFWYRDNGNQCSGLGFNFTNAWATVWSL